MKKIILSSAFFPLLCFSQNPKTDKVINQVGSAAEVAGNVIGLFKKNKNITAENSGNKTSENKASVIFGKLLSIGNSTGAGKITNNTIAVDCDRMYPFVNGVAIIEKGNSKALINAKGETVIPFNRYTDIKYHGVNFTTAYSPQSNGTLYLDHSGKTIVDEGQWRKKGFGWRDASLNIGGASGTSYQYYVIMEQTTSKNHQVVSKDYYIIDEKANQKKITASRLANGFENIEVIYKDVALVSSPVKQSNRRLYGLKDLNDKLILPHQYEFIGEFVDGYACIGKSDSFGAMNYGIINSAGKLVVEMKYSNQITVFGGGYFGVIPHSDQQYSFILLDSSANAVYKINRNDTTAAYETVPTNFEDGFLFSKNYIFVNNKPIKVADFLRSKGFSVPTGGYAQFIGHENAGFLYFNSRDYSMYDDSIAFQVSDNKGNNSVGFYFPKSGKLLVGSFTNFSIDARGQTGYDYFFDTVSGLSSQLSIKNNTPTSYDIKKDYTRGNIDRDGNFVIIEQAAKKE
ncbi:WG repeat-containing protein [Soonwooa sp.]|uniref:WG repeat-containing protein n=1 Tax=Soonwooa sp. TaxID=1938592 RepID=UPI0035ADDD3F